MKDRQGILTFNEFDEYYIATNGRVRSKIPDFHIFRLSDIGPHVVQKMEPFKINYFHFSLGIQLSTNLSVFGEQLISEDFTLVIFLPGQIIEWERSGEWSGYVIDVKDSFLDLPLLNQSIESFHYLVEGQPLVIKMAQEDFNGLSYFYELIYNEHKSLNKESIFVIKNLMQVLLLYIPRIIKRNNPENKIVKPSFPNYNRFMTASKFQSLVVKEYTHSKSVHYYAGKLNVNPAFLNKCTKLAFNKTPKDIINHALLLHAKTLLKKTELGIKEIAFELNFDDYSHFVKFFKAQTGHTPADFRQNLG